MAALRDATNLPQAVGTAAMLDGSLEKRLQRAWSDAEAAGSSRERLEVLEKLTGGLQPPEMYAKYARFIMMWLEFIRLRWEIGADADETLSLLKRLKQVAKAHANFVVGWAAVEAADGRPEKAKSLLREAIESGVCDKPEALYDALNTLTAGSSPLFPCIFPPVTTQYLSNVPKEYTNMPAVPVATVHFEIPHTSSANHATMTSVTMSTMTGTTTSSTTTTATTTSSSGVTTGSSRASLTSSSVTATSYKGPITPGATPVATAKSNFNIMTNDSALLTPAPTVGAISVSRGQSSHVATIPGDDGYKSALKKERILRTTKLGLPIRVSSTAVAGATVQPAELRAPVQPLEPPAAAPSLTTDPVPAAMLMTALPLVPASAPTSAPAPTPQPHEHQRSSAGNSNKIVSVNGIPYTKLEVIGKGGSSKVFRVMSENGKILALKRVNFAEADNFARTSYINEIALLRRLQGNENIVTLFDAEVNEQDKVIYMVMECGEIDLARMLAKRAGKPLDENFIRLYWQQMLQAVQAIHDQRIVHSDIKPANFLMVEGALKLIDFGIATTIQADTTSVLRENQMGTINYMSPEALANEHGGKHLKLGRPSDVWALGCILHQMVYGATPFASLMSPLQKIRAICDPSHEISFPPIRNQALLDVMKRCLSRDPAARPAIPTLLEHKFLHP